MKIGLSSYSLFKAMRSGHMTIIDVIEWVAEYGGEHIEIVPDLGFSLTERPELIELIREKANQVGIEISNYAIGANFITETTEMFTKELERVKKEVDIANQLGVKFMRHDIASRPIPEATDENFKSDLPKLVEACREIADYASRYGMTTSVENHGFYVQASERIQALVNEVNRPNFKTTLDVGNFLCVDEEPLEAVKNNVSLASIIHIKDFLYRQKLVNPGTGWIETANGNFIRGTIVGHGDLKMKEIMSVIKNSGYDGYLTIEFEGMEDCETASKLGMENVRRLWNEVSD